MNKPELRITNILNNDVVATSCQEVFGVAVTQESGYYWWKNNSPSEQYIENYKNGHGGSMDGFDEQYVNDHLGGYVSKDIEPGTYHIDSEGRIIGPCIHTNPYEALEAHGIRPL